MQRHKETGLGGGDLDRVEVCVRRAKQSADRRLDTFIYQTCMVDAASFGALTSCDLHNLILVRCMVLLSKRKVIDMIRAGNLVS